LAIGVKTKNELFKTYTEEAKEKGLSINEKKKKNKKENAID
jgi:hypothetical protein